MVAYQDLAQQKQSSIEMLGPYSYENYFNDT